MSALDDAPHVHADDRATWRGWLETHHATARELTRENNPDSPVVQELRRQVANTFVLYANYKHYHWQTCGPLFRDLHK